MRPTTRSRGYGRWPLSIRESRRAALRSHDRNRMCCATRAWRSIPSTRPIRGTSNAGCGVTRTDVTTGGGPARMCTPPRSSRAGCTPNTWPISCTRRCGADGSAESVWNTSGHSRPRSIPRAPERSSAHRRAARSGPAAPWSAPAWAHPRPRHTGKRPPTASCGRYTTSRPTARSSPPAAPWSCWERGRARWMPRYWSPRPVRTSVSR